MAYPPLTVQLRREQSVIGENSLLIPKVSEVNLLELDSERLWGCNIEAPEAGRECSDAFVEVIGWVLGRQIPVKAVEIVATTGVVQHTPLNVRRPDVAEHYPEAGEPDLCGFRTFIRVGGAAREEFLVQAVRRDQSRVPIGIVRVRTEPTDRGLSDNNRCAQLPVGGVSFGDLRRISPVSPVFGFDRGMPIDRYYIENFLASEAAHIRGHVLEIGDNIYTQKFGAGRVSASDVLHVVEGNPQATIVGDLASASHIPANRFDCVILTQTLQCIYDVRAAVNTLYRILKPGGVVLATVPGITKISHRDWGYTWYWNFTALSARRLFEEAFPASAVQVQVHGNVLAAISFLHGVAAEELSRQELEYRDPDYEVLLTVKAAKPEERVENDLGSTRRRVRRHIDDHSVRTAVILLYHRVVDSTFDPWRLCVSPKNFREHLQILHDHYHPISLGQLAGAQTDADLPERPVVITFDDGYADNFHTAKPLLENYETPATVFVTAGRLGQRDFWWDELGRIFLKPGTLPRILRVTIAGNSYQWDLEGVARYGEAEYQQTYEWKAWEDPPTARHRIYQSLWNLLHPLAERERQKVLSDIRLWAAPESIDDFRDRPVSREELSALAQGWRIDIGAHTMTHSNLSALSPSEQWDEIQQSKIQLEAILGRTVTTFAYPYGRQCDYTRLTADLVRNIGFACACSNFPGVVDQSTDRFQLPRMQIQDWNGMEFARRLDQWFGRGGAKAASL